MVGNFFQEAEKIFFSVITKNSNWEMLTKNLYSYFLDKMG